MKTSRSALAAAILACFVLTPSYAAERHDFRIPAGPLAAALAQLARQSGIDIGATDPGISGARTSGVNGHMSPRTALDRLLAGSGYRVQAIDGSAYRLVRDGRPKAMLRTARSNPPATTSTPDSDIIVTAGKKAAPLLRYPGSVAIMQSESGTIFGTDDTRDLHMIAAGQSILQTTNLGDGRNKLFVRGIADSSFAGPTRSTANVYLGEVQLGYNGADPNLNLYDISRVEVLEGPQGALYGAGSIGGIIRLTPNAPIMSRFAASGMSMVGATEGGARSYALAAMANVPLIDDLAAVRAVGFLSHDGGYIDDGSRRLRNVNRSVVKGGRGTLRVTPGNDWIVDVGVVAQGTTAPDSQYTLRDAPRLSRNSNIAQPFKGDFKLVHGVVTKRWDSGLQFVSATGLVKHHFDDRYDATALARPGILLAYDTHDRNRLFTQEARLSRSVTNGNSWLVGLSYINDHDAIQRELGQPGNPIDIAGVTNRATDISAFGETTIAINPALSLTAGSRLTFARTDSDPVFTRGTSNFIRGRSSRRLSPMFAANGLLTQHISVFARYGSGFRTGGLAVAAGIGRVANFTPDSIRVIEAGVRLQRSGPLGVSASASLSQARWHQIQADLVDRRGFPYTTNIGDGRINGLEASVDWIPMTGLKLDGALFFNRSNLFDPIGALARERGNALPDTPRFSANSSIGYEWRAGEQDVLSLSGTGRYRGHSFVGFGTMLNVTQGGYAVVDLSAGWRHRWLGLSLGLENVTNRGGNVFALGNPFGVADRNQMTPLRPRTLRLSLSFAN